MRKRIINQTVLAPQVDGVHWLDLSELAQVELTSEAAGFPIEVVFDPAVSEGWRADQPGVQTIRLLFDVPQNIQRIQLHFFETERARTQEFVLSWAADAEDTWHEIVRQQYNFSPPDGTQELEEFAVQLQAVQRLELNIVPDISGGSACASLLHWRVA